MNKKIDLAFRTMMKLQKHRPAIKDKMEASISAIKFERISPTFAIYHKVIKSRDYISRRVPSVDSEITLGVYGRIEYE